MPDTLSRAINDSNLPDGTAHNIAKGGDLDKLWDGISDSQEATRIRLKKLADQRNPFETDMLEDLERDYGIRNDPRLTDAEQRKKLAGRMFAGTDTGAADYLQSQLQAAGFDLQVYQNDPAVDPDLFVSGNFNLQIDGDNAFVGRIDAFLRQTGGELIVSGIDGMTVVDTLSVIGPGSFCGNANMFCGRFDDSRIDPKIYTVPTESGYWPSIFFVGGDATRDPITNAITEIELAEVLAIRRPELRDLIIRYKPMKTWAAVIINYI